MDIKVILLISATIIASATSIAVPNYIHVCKRNDPEVSKCIIDAVEILKPRLKKGIPELDVPGIEPFKIPDIDVSRGSPNFKLLLKDLEVFGGSEFKITKLKLNVPNLIFRVQALIPLFRLVGKYDVNTRILVVPIEGTGNFFANASNVVGTGLLKAKIIEENGEKHMNFTKLDMKLTIGDYSVRIDNLLNGDPIFTQTANDIINGNRQEILAIATPLIERRASSVLLDVANRICKNFIYDEVFPEE